MRIGVGLAGILAMSNKEHRLIHENKTHRQRCTKYTVDSQEVKAMTNRFWERAAQKGTASYYCTVITIIVMNIGSKWPTWRNVQIMQGRKASRTRR
ncbi:hypothetical protein ACP3W8_07400 [Vibrio anguillarum]